MPEPSLFRHYQIVQDADGNTVELLRDAQQVTVLAFDTKQLEFVHCHVLLSSPEDKAAFESSCAGLQGQGHPLLARLVDFGEDDGNPFYITTNIDGETLRSYLSRQQELPGWLALLIALRATDAVLALVQVAEVLPEDPLNALRVVQTGPHQLQVQVADYQLATGEKAKSKALKTAFENSAKQLRSFFQEHSQSGPTLVDQTLPVADFTDLLASALGAVSRGVVSGLRELRGALQKLSPEGHLSEIPTANKPRALLAPHFASYQEVARGVVNLVRIQSQRLDMANPYSMRGTLTKTGRTVLVEQVLSPRLVGANVKKQQQQTQAATKKQDFGSLVALVLMHTGDEVSCMAEELPEGISLADLLKERRVLSVHEAYLLLASLDGALASLEKSGLETPRLRLEDIFLITGFPREDARTAKLLLTKLNEWPTFSLLLRAHPTLASMVGRGVNPAVLLPKSAADHSRWDGAWLSSVGRFLVGIQPLPGQTPEASAGRDRESVERLFDEEIGKVTAGKPSQRADFLARYARILQHHDLVKPTPAPVAELPEPVKAKPPARTRPISASPTAAEPAAPILALTSGLPPLTEKPTIGFAELLFRDTSVTESGGVHDWAKTAGDAPPTINPAEVLLPPSEFVPLWLRAAVFIGGSLVIGALLAHTSGKALWQQNQVRTPQPLIQSSVPRAVPVPAASGLPPEPPAGPAAPAVSVPTLPAEAAPTDLNRNLLQPPSSGLKKALE